MASSSSKQATFKRILLLTLPSTADPDKPCSASVWKNISKDDIVDAVRSVGGLTLVPRAEYEQHDAAAGPLELTSLRMIELQDGGEYIIWFADSPLKESVKELRGYRDSQVSSCEEDELAERLVAQLQENGHPEAQRVCVKKIAGDGIQLEADALVAANNCYMLAEVKTKLASDHVFELLTKASKLRRITASEKPPSSVEPLIGKRQMLVLAGRTLTSNAQDLSELRDECRKAEVEVWLPNGSSWGLGNACFPSPHTHFGRSGSNVAVQATASRRLAVLASPPARVHGGRGMGRSMTVRFF